MNEDNGDIRLFRAWLEPENELEERLLAEPGFRDGLKWGVPRFGHPEGEVYKHVREVLSNIDQLDGGSDERRRLRLIAYVHDTFKYREDKSVPRNWDRHHGKLARNFLEPFCEDERLLDIVELHDEAYYCWRFSQLLCKPELGKERLERLFSRLDDELPLFFRFFVCDTLTGDKIMAPLYWFEQRVPRECHFDYRQMDQAADTSLFRISS